MAVSGRCGVSCRPRSSPAAQHRLGDVFSLCAGPCPLPHEPQDPRVVVAERGFGEVIHPRYLEHAHQKLRGPSPRRQGEQRVVGSETPMPVSASAAEHTVIALRGAMSRVRACQGYRFGAISSRSTRRRSLTSSSESMMSIAFSIGVTIAIPVLSESASASAKSPSHSSSLRQ
jgi:hypothetical protein